MRRIVQRAIIDAWLKDNRPDAIGVLARKARIPSTTISKIRRGKVPYSELQRESLALALGVTMAQLFPVLQDEEGQAS